MLHVLVIGLGGFIGASSRYLLGNVVMLVSPTELFPFATITVNLLGCFFAGITAYMVEHRLMVSQQFANFVLIGFLGAFTTFSTYSIESYRLMKSGEMFLMWLNILIQTILGIAAIVLAYSLMARLHPN